MREECPKCRRPTAWYERGIHDLTLRCLCGLNKVVFTKLETITIEHRDTDNVRLPKELTNLWYTVMVLSVLELATSAEITERLVDLGKPGKMFTVSDVSSYLTILRAKGLVQTIEFRRRMVGGSTWKLTDRCAALVGVG